MFATINRYDNELPSALNWKTALPLARESLVTPAGMTSSAEDIGVPKLPPLAFVESVGAWSGWVTTGTEIGAVGCGALDEHAASSIVPAIVSHAALDMVLLQSPAGRQV
jgi:hypothetical protein